MARLEALTNRKQKLNEMFESFIIDYGATPPEDLKSLTMYLREVSEKQIEQIDQALRNLPDVFLDTQCTDSETRKVDGPRDRRYSQGRVVGVVPG